MKWTSAQISSHLLLFLPLYVLQKFRETKERLKYFSFQTLFYFLQKIRECIDSSVPFLLRKHFVKTCTYAYVTILNLPPFLKKIRETKGYVHEIIDLQSFFVKTRSALNFLLLFSCKNFVKKRSFTKISWKQRITWIFFFLQKSFFHFSAYLTSLLPNS